MDLAVLALIVWCCFGAIGAALAAARGRSGCGWFALCFLFGPLAVILALAMQPRRDVLERRAVTSGGMKSCPFCAELIRAKAVKCKHCQSDLSIEEAEPLERVQHRPSQALRALREKRRKGDL